MKILVRLQIFCKKIPDSKHYELSKCSARIHVNAIRQNLSCRGVACPFIICDTMAFFLLQEFEIKSSYNDFWGKAKRRIYKLNKLTINANFPTGVYSTRYREIAVHSGNKISTVHLRHKFQIRKLKISMSTIHM